MIERLKKPRERENRVPEPRRAEKQRIRRELCAEQENRCYLCGKGFDDFFRVPVIEHVVPGKMGGCKDWSRSNLKAACWTCNNEKGSKRA